MRVRSLAPLAVAILALHVGQACAPSEYTTARCAGLVEEDCRLAHAAALEALDADSRGAVADWRLEPTKAAACGAGEPSPLLDVVFLLRTSPDPLAVTIGRSDDGRPVACSMP